MIKTSIVQGNSAIRAFNDKGVFYGSEAVSEGGPLLVKTVKPETENSWDLGVMGESLRPVSLLGYKSTGVSSSDSLIVRVKQDNAVIWDMDIANHGTVLGNSLLFDFPFLVLSQNQSLNVISSVSLDALWLFNKVVYFNSVVSPQT